MPYTPTGRPVGRPKTKDSKTISLKMPQDLLARVQRYAREHHQSVSALHIRDGDAVSCEVLDRCLDVSRYLLERAPQWLG